MSKSYIKYILAVLLFGSNGLVASHIALSSYEIVLMRTLLGSLLLFVIYLLMKGKFGFFRYKKQFVFLAVSGVALGGSWMFLFEAYREIGVSIASLVYYCGPVIVMVLSPFLFKERLTWPKITGFISVLAGVVFVSGQTIQSGNMGWGLFCGAMSAVLYAVMVIFNKQTKEITGLENSMLQLFFGFLTVAVFVGVKQGFTLGVHSEDWPAILILGLVNTGIGCYLYFSSIGSLPVQTVAICGYLEPLAAVVLSVLILKEGMVPIQMLGIVLILGGALFGELFKAGKKKTGEEKVIPEKKRLLK